MPAPAPPPPSAEDLALRAAKEALTKFKTEREAAAKARADEEARKAEASARRRQERMDKVPEGPNALELLDAPQEADADAGRALVESGGSSNPERDVTVLPTALEGAFDSLGASFSAFRPTTFKLGQAWLRRRQKTLLSPMAESTLNTDEQSREKKLALDLLDALTRSGALALEETTLHVIVAQTHVFQMSVLDTLVQKNVNPIDVMERGGLVIAQAVFGAPDERALLAPNHEPLPLQQ